MLLLLGLGCLIQTDRYEARRAVLLDGDADGHRAAAEGGDDCDDADPTVHPDADDAPYDGVDQDCSGADLTDVDGDGYGGGAAGPDCDDGDADISPAATDTPYDGVDQDCSGADLADLDGDGYDGGDGPDCDDTDAEVFPGGEERCYDGIDQDCADDSDFDCDQDGVTSSEFGGTDCNDADGSTYPDAVEAWHDVGTDNDCDDSVTDAVQLSLDAADEAYFAADTMGWLGYRVGTIEDIDGDAVDDIWALAPYDELGGDFAGAAVLIRSCCSAVGPLGDTDQEYIRLFGPEDAYILGAAGISYDFSGDGASDLLASSAVAGSDAGAVLGWSSATLQGLTGDGSAAALASIAIAGRPGEYFGTGLVSGDIDGDGVSDLIVDAFGAGRAYLFYGPTFASTSDDADVVVSSDVPLHSQSPGDLNHDGNDDWILTREASDASQVTTGLIYGSGSLPSDLGEMGEAAVTTFIDMLRFGAYANDGDGCLLLLGETGAAGFYGVRTGELTSGEADFSLGSSVQYSGGTYLSWYRAGVVGFLLATTSDSGSHGFATIWESEQWTGSVDDSSAMLSILGSRAGDHAFEGFALVADRNGDGQSELLVGAPQEDSSGVDRGAVYLQYSP